MRNIKKTMTKFQLKVQQMELLNKMRNPIQNEILFSEMGTNKHLENILYGVWNDDEENLLYC